MRYRGNGWPGDFRAECRERSESLSYGEAWGRLTKHRPFRCNLCPDGLGRLADISCGDAWHRYSGQDDNPGLSLVLVRTRRGQEIVRQARDAGYLSLRPSSTWAVKEAQKNLLERRREIYGRLLAMKLLRIPTPRFTGFSLAEEWRKKSLSGKIRTVLGTIKRLIRKGLWRRRPLYWPEVATLISSANAKIPQKSGGGRCESEYLIWKV